MDTGEIQDYLGHTYQDKVTEFEGVATQYAVFISGLDRVLLMPKVGEDGKKQDGRWFDAQRLIRSAGSERVVL